ncbi:MAG TPA: sulfatase-like hydrolase/transferase [Armatimonadaceae bacterium]|nr:sulfatase-like hydrolase/transferase [Armatimonadaceae bacterium]
MPTPEPERPPNVLFLMSDQHRADVAGYEGNPVVRTPVLDALARTGVVFRSAYTPSPICIPGRQALLSGQFPRTCGCERFGDDLPPFSMTFARRLAQFGYRTVCAGKLHHTGVDQMQGWTKRIAPDCDVSDRYIDGADPDALARYKPAPGTGKWTNQKEVERAGIGSGPHQAFDRRAVESTLDFIDDYFSDPFYDRPGAHRPLLLKVSLLQPHYPFFAEAEKFRHYLNRVPLFLEGPSDHPWLGKTQYGPNVQASERDVRRTTAAYYAMVETVDTYFGQVLRALEQAGQDLDDWVIVYTSDHGEMLGEHGIWEKTQFYEASARVPLIIRWPARFAPRVVTRNVNLCDLFATLCDLCDVPRPNPADTVGGRGLDSRSLVPLMRNGDTGSGWDDESVSQFNGGLMIKQGALKYLYYGEEVPEVVFDLAADPGEREDVVADPRHAEAVAGFRRRRAALGFGPDADPEYRGAGYNAHAS